VNDSLDRISPDGHLRMKATLSLAVSVPSGLKQRD
jgi:hypothetical protein